MECRRPRPRSALCASLRSRNARGRCRRTTLCENLQGKCRKPRPRTTLCASVRSRNALGCFTKAILCEKCQKHAGAHDRSKCTWTFHKSHQPFVQEFTSKMRRPRPPPTLCASLCNRNALGHFLSDTLCENLQVKCRRPRPRPALCASLRSRNALGHFTRAKLCQNLQKNAGAQIEHPHRAPAFTLTVRTPQCGHAVWGKNHLTIHSFSQYSFKTIPL